MTGAPGTDPYREWDAAYVLGALAPEERRAYERHLGACDACRQAVAELAGMPGLLASVPRDVAGAAVQPADAGGAAGDPGGVPAGAGAASAGADVVPLAALAGAARRRRRRGRTLLAAAAVGLVAVGGLGGASVVGTDRDGPVVVADARTVSLTPVGGSGVTADLTLTPARWGTRLDWWCEYTADELAEGVYELVVVDAHGRREVVGTWSSTGERTAAGLGASVAVPADGIRRVELGVVGLDVPLAAADVRAAA